MSKIKKYSDEAGRKIVEVDSLNFLKERRGYSWIGRHLRNVRYRRACRKADMVIVPDEGVSFDVRHYYFISRDKVRVREEKKG